MGKHPPRSRPAYDCGAFTRTSRSSGHLGVRSGEILKRSSLLSLPLSWGAWRRRSGGLGTQVLALMAEWGWLMAAVSIRNLDDDVKERLRMRAASHGRSMESEIRAILVEAVTAPDQHPGLLVTLMERFGDIGGVDLEVPARTTPARAADLSARLLSTPTSSPS